MIQATRTLSACFDTHDPWLCAEGVTLLALRLGTEGSRSRMHYDINHNFVIQLAGKKEWFLSSLANFSYYGYPTQHSHSRQHYNKNASLEAKDQFAPPVNHPQQYRFTMGENC